MAITRDTTTSTNVFNSGTTTTLSVAAGASSNMIVMTVGCLGTAPIFSAPTWNGNAMTLGPSGTFPTLGGAEGLMAIYYIQNSTTGTNNLSITYSFSGGSSNTFVGGHAFTGVDTSQTVTNGSSTATADAVNTAITMPAGGGWVVCLGAGSSNGLGMFSSNMTARSTTFVMTGTTKNASIRLFDTDASLAAGAQTVNLNSSGENLLGYVLSIPDFPLAPAGGGGLLLMGVGS